MPSDGRDATSRGLPVGSAMPTPKSCDAASQASTLAGSVRRSPDSSRSSRTSPSRWFAVVVERDLAAGRFRWEGTHSAEIAGIAATGRRVDWVSADRWRAADGELAEHCDVIDWSHLIGQLTIAVDPRADAGADVAGTRA